MMEQNLVILGLFLGLTFNILHEHLIRLDYRGIFSIFIRRKRQKTEHF